MHKFAETEYKWCPQCAGNIRESATYCRFCHKPLSNRLMQRVSIPPFVIVRSISEWLPNFSEVKAKLPPEFLHRIEMAASEKPAVQVGESMEEMRRHPGGESLCVHEAPDSNVYALLMDLLLALHSKGESIVDVCDQPQMKLLEITPQEVLAEFELRQSEMEKGHQCIYCQEFIIGDDECRFCGGTLECKPKAVEHSWYKPVDPILLREVILYEAGWRFINQEEAIPAEILEVNSITQKDVDRQALSISCGESELPMARFTRRMIDLKLSSYFTPEHITINDLADLGAALDRKNEDRSDESLIVLEHALRRTEGNDAMMQERSNVLSKLASHYLQKKDDPKYELYNSMAHECSKFGMTAEMQAMMDKSHESLKNIFKNEKKLETDPEKRLASLDTDFGMGLDGMDEMLAQLEGTLPGLGELFSGLQSSMEATMKSTRLTLEAQVAENSGDLATAEAKYREALSINEKDDLTGSMTKLSTMCSLAKVKQLQGDNDAAESLLKEALFLASELVEAQPLLGGGSLYPALTSYACFLRDVGRFAESEEKFQRALQAEEESSSAWLKEYGGSTGDYCAQRADIKEKYAQLLRAMKRDDEAEKLEAEIVSLKKEAEERQAELQARRAKFQ